MNPTPSPSSIIIRTLAALAATILASCNSQPTTNAEINTVQADSKPTDSSSTVFDQLTGTWKNEDGKTYEEWTKNPNGTYRCRAYSIIGNDTADTEEAKIYPENNKWVFENKVRGQNDGKAVRFTSTQLSNNSVQFSNPTHDFPTDVNYTVAGINKVRAFIIGPNKNGGKDTISFNYTRVN